MYNLPALSSSPSTTHAQTHSPTVCSSSSSPSPFRSSRQELSATSPFTVPVRAPVLPVLRRRVSDIATALPERLRDTTSARERSPADYSLPPGRGGGTHSQPRRSTIQVRGGMPRRESAARSLGCDSRPTLPVLPSPRAFPVGAEGRLDRCRCPVPLLIASRRAQRSSCLPTFAIVRRRGGAQAPRLTATTCSSFAPLRRVEHAQGGVQESSRVRTVEYCSMHVSEHVEFRACRSTSSPVPSAEFPADCSRPVIPRSSRDLPSGRHSSPSLSILKTSRPGDPVVAVQSVCTSRACLRESEVRVHLPERRIVVLNA